MEPASFLVENLALLRRGTALDIAMGEGRNAVFLARQGFAVEGVDISPESVKKALEEAHQQGAGAWELRTATSLARLWRNLGRATEASTLLRPILARLTEGFTTVDAQAARSLLAILP